MRPPLATFSLRLYGALCLAVLAVTSLWFVWNETVARSRLLDLGRSYALEGAEDIAARAVVPTLVGESIPDIVDRLATAHVGRGDILALQLADAHNIVLGAYGDPTGALARCKAALPIVASQLQSSALLLPRINAWCLSVPVRQTQATAECPHGGCATGRLWVVQGTRPVALVLDQMQASLFRSAVIVVALGLLLSLWLARRLMRPLLTLESIMRLASSGDRSIKAPVTRGPVELRNMGLVFNEMQDQASRYESTLKDQVRERTQQLELARAQAVDAAQYKSEFMTHVSHDMRMPLVVIKDLARDGLRELAFGADQESLEDSFRRIARRADALITQIELIIGFMRSEHLVSLPARPGLLNLKSFVLSIRRDLELLAYRNGNQIQWDVQDGTATLDEQALGTILENLTDNAAKFTINGKIGISLHFDERWVIVGVSDSGCGISAEHLPFVWDDFRRAPAGTASSAQGFGLGLAIVRRIVDGQGGEREISSTVARGTTVTVRLPRFPASMRASGQGGVSEEREVQQVDAPVRHYRTFETPGEVVDQGVANAGQGRKPHVEPTTSEMRKPE